MNGMHTWFTIAALSLLPTLAHSANREIKDCRQCPALLILPGGALPNGEQLRSFAIGKFEITQAEWFAVMGNRPSEFVGDKLPVETVSWIDVQAFVRKLSKKTGKRYRLPTEAEWEYAARGGHAGPNYSFGDDPTRLDQYAWFIDNSNDSTHPVGQKLPNAFGLYDTHGNVWEWTADCSRDAKERRDDDETVAKYIRDCHRSYRGGSMANKAPSLKLTYSQSGGVGDRYFALGLRIARSL